jgi:hypothetical protein
MDYVIPALAGVFLKLNDDYIVDEPYITDPFVTATLKTVEVMLYTLTAHNDFWLSSIFALFNGLAAIASWKEYSNPHVFAYFFVTPFLLLLSIPHYTSLRLFDYPVVFGLLAFGLVEPRLFPEEASWTKFAARGLSAYIGLTGIWMYHGDLSLSVVRGCLLFTGYAIMSSLSQMLKLTVLPLTSSPQYA